MKWYAGCDHAGLALNKQLVAALRARGDEVVDVGNSDEARCDYPGFGAAVGKRVVDDPGALGLLVSGSGVGINIAANDVLGVRCALVHDTVTAELARLNNDANVVAFGAREIDPSIAALALQVFRSTRFHVGWRQRQVDQLGALDRR